MTSPFLPCKSELKKSLKEVELLCFTELRDPVEQEIEEATAGANSATVVVKCCGRCSWYCPIKSFFLPSHQNKK